ncbi:MAG: nucleoside-diphosphate sugar epimerase/dehydratase, partial [Candidatus Paceibacterota bacterium]
AMLSAINILICLPVFYWQKLYLFTWAYVSVQELVLLLRAAAFSFLATLAALFLLREYPLFSGFPRSTIFIAYFFIFLFCGGIRFAKRAYLSLSRRNDVGKGMSRTLIVGAGDAGEQLLRSILAQQGSAYLPVGFVDDNKAKLGNLIHGIKVLGLIENLPQIAANQHIESIIIALPAAGSKAIKRAVEISRKSGVKNLKVLPSITELIDGQITVANVREVDVEDLLEREPVSLDTVAIGDFIRGKTILVTGAAGSIGSELCRQVMKFKPKILLVLDQDETGIFNIEKELKSNYSNADIFPLIADICDAIKIKHIFEKFRPEVVFHAAAYKHVPLMEGVPDEAVKNNVFGTKTVAAAALAARAEKFVMISTDKAVNPTSIMGATKRICEMVCQNFNGENITKFISVRFGNVLNSRGSVIPTFRGQIKKGGPVEVTDPEMTRYFMLTSEACLLVMQAGAMGNGGEIFVLDMGKPVKILDLAREMIRLSGFEPDKDIAIVFVGRRPGEKLYEELLTAAEGTIATQNQKIFIAKMADVDANKFNGMLDDIRAAALSCDKEKIISSMKELIPDYLK